MWIPSLSKSLKLSRALRIVVPAIEDPQLTDLAPGSFGLNF
jgi:hypothetical protein